MTIPYSSGKTLSIDQLTNVNITDIANNNLLQYNSTNGEWSNGNDINIDEIDARVLRISETADIGGRLANQGVASFVNDEFIFQNGISNLGDTIYIDNNNNRVGIGITNPEEDLEVDGSIQIDSASVARLKFQQSGMNPHALSEIDGEQDGVDGGQLEFYTKVDTGSLTEKLRINNVGGIGIGGANYGTSGQVLTSGGSGGPVSWTTPSTGITQYATFTYQTTTEQLITNTFTRLEYDTTNTIGGSDITLDTTTNIGRITLATTGVYMINYYSTGYIFAGSTRVITQCVLYVNPNTGTFTGEDGTRTYFYLRQTADPENTAGASYLLTVYASNTEIELRFKTEDPANVSRMKRKSCGITIVKIA